MSYALATLWYERQRYLPGVLAVGFSALLIALQAGLLLGLFSITSLPIDHSHADIWMGAPNVLSVDLGEPIREGHLGQVASQPEVVRTEIYEQGFAYWSKPRGGRELCMVIGSRLEPDSLGKVDALNEELCMRLTEPGTVVVDESDLDRLGIRGVGDTAEITGTHVRVVGLTKGLRSLAGPYVFCSIATARPLLHLQLDQVTYVLGKCRRREDAPGVVQRLKQEYQRSVPVYNGGRWTYEPSVSVFTAREFSTRSRLHWLFKTKAGFALGYAAALGLLVGAVVTSQTLYAATVASLREYAVLRALGIPRWRMALMVMAQSFWVGAVGIGLALPVFYGLAHTAEHFNVPVERPVWLLGGTAVVTLGMALLAGFLALRSLRQVEPAVLLR
jgi:putative ABC transport system permease protein